MFFVRWPVAHTLDAHRHRHVNVKTMDDFIFNHVEHYVDAAQWADCR